MCNDAEAGGLKLAVKNSWALPEILSIKGLALTIVSLPGGPLVKSAFAQDLPVSHRLEFGNSAEVVSEIST